MNFNFPDAVKKIFMQLSHFASETNQPIFVIGGFVRDTILKRPTKDIDIVITTDCLDFAEGFALKYYPRTTVNYFKTYGTAQIKLEQFEIQFVTSRSESYEKTSRNPIVAKGSLEDDQKRRDFTVNCLAINLSKDNYMALSDPFDGIQDIFYKLLRTPLQPEKTFSDDPLRMLRAVRFATQLEFTIEKNTFIAIQKMAFRLDIVSRERIVDELQKIMESPKPSIGWYLIDQTGLLKHILPDLDKMKGVENLDGIGHKDNFDHSLQVLDNVASVSNDLWLRWAALLHDIGKPKTKKFDEKNGWTFHGHEVVGSKMVAKIFFDLKMPKNEKLDFVQKIIYLHHRPISLTKENITDSALRRLIFDAGEDLEKLLLLCRADITSKNKEKVTRYLKNFEIVEQKLKQVEGADQLKNWQPPVNGEHIMKTFNLEPCRRVGIIKEAIKEAILEGTIQNNFKEAEQYMLKLLKK